MEGDFQDMLPYDNNLKDFSRKLRKNMTDAEKALWLRIRGRQIKGYQFFRQKPIGSFIVDFYCPKGNLVIELDGGQHYSEEGQAKDRQRDDYLRGEGLRILRFSDKEIFENIAGVLEKIWSIL
jgi:very-short-patch-repair endonuclease